MTKVGNKMTKVGNPDYSLLLYKYLRNKYRNSCIIFMNKRNPVSHAQISIRYNEKLNKLVFPRNFWKQFFICKKRFVIIPFGYTCENSSGHSNVLIYDRKIKSLERFEPYGGMKIDAGKCFNENVDVMLFNEFNKRKLIDYYYEPKSYIPKKGFQTIQEDEKKMIKTDPIGFCSIWIIFYCELRLNNPNTDKKILIKKVLKDIKKNNFTEFIRDYNYYLENEFNKVK